MNFCVNSGNFYLIFLTFLSKYLEFYNFLQFFANFFFLFFYFFLFFFSFFLFFFARTGKEDPENHEKVPQNRLECQYPHPRAQTTESDGLPSRRETKGAHRRWILYPNINSICQWEHPINHVDRRIFNLILRNFDESCR